MFHRIAINKIGTGKSAAARMLQHSFVESARKSCLNFAYNLSVTCLFSAIMQSKTSKNKRYRILALLVTPAFLLMFLHGGGL